MNKRMQLNFEKDGKIVKITVPKRLAGVLYVNGEKGDKVISWIVHHVELQKGKDKTYTGKDILKEGKIKIPLNIRAEVKKIGVRKTVLVRTGRHIKERIHKIVNGVALLQEDTLQHLTNEQKKHLEKIDIWDVHDELVNIFSKGQWKPSWYIGALQQILNKVEPREKIVPETVKKELNSLTGVDITLSVNDYVFTFFEGSFFDCKGNIVRSFAFDIDRVDLVRRYFESQGYKFKWAKPV